MLNRPLKILVAIEGYYPEIAGGSMSYVREMTRSLVGQNHKITIITPTFSKKFPEHEIAHNLEILRYTVHLKQHNLVRYLVSNGAESAYKKYLVRTHFDILSLHSPYIGMALINSMMGKNVPVVYHFHSPHHEEEKIIKNSISYSYLNPKRYLKKIWSPISLKEIKRTEGKCLEFSDLIITLSQFMKSKLLDTHPVPEEKIKVVPGGVDTERFYPVQDRIKIRKELQLPTDNPMILTVRRLVPRMGLETLLLAMQKVVQYLDKVQLFIGGSGFLLNKLQNMVEELELVRNVHFLGYIPDDMLPNYYQASDLFVLPTRELEGFGLVTLESLASGTPVIGTNVGATPEILKFFDPDLLIPPDDPEIMAEKILGYFSCPWWRTYLHRKSQKFAKSNFDWNLVTKKLEYHYYKLVDTLGKNKVVGV